MVALFSAGLLMTFAGSAQAAEPPTVPLGVADSFAVLAGSEISDVPTSDIIGAVGLSPAAGSKITGLTCAEVIGTIYAVDATGLPCFVPNADLLTTAKDNLTTAYLEAAGRTPTTTYGADDNQLGGKVLGPGVYSSVMRQLPT